MPTSTTNYGLIKPGTDDPILIGQLNDNADVIDATLKSLSDALDVAKLGIKYKGEVNYYSNLPTTGVSIGDAYTVKYAGSSGTTPDGTEYVWGTVSGTNQWINFSKDSYTKAEVDALLTLKQNALNSAQLAAVNSGIDSAKVEQIETNKNNISLNKTDIYNNFAIGKNKLTYTLTTLQSLNTDGTWNNNEWTKNGVTFTLNPDNTITATGTLPASTNVIMTLQNYTGVTGDILTAEQYGADHYIYLRGGSTVVNNVIYKAFAGSDIGVSREVAIAIIGEVSESKTVHYLFKPMVCDKSAYLASPTYFPYAMSNVELTEKEQQLELKSNVISSTTTVSSYADSAPFGYSIAFCINGQLPSDAPVTDNIFIEIFKYSQNTIVVRVMPTANNYYNNMYVMAKVSGTWQSWCTFTGTT